MKKIYSRVEEGKLLHIINRYYEIEGRTDVAPPNEFLQLATLKMEKGKTFRPHKHIWKPCPNGMIIAQESWVVIIGSVKVHLYDIDDELKAIYHSKDTVCIWVFKTREDRNRFMDETAGMHKDDREKYFESFYG